MIKINYMFLVLLLIILISTTPIFAVDLIEEGIGDYKYDKTRVRGETESFPPSYILTYNKSEERVVVAIIEFDDKDYLSDWISSKTKENMSLFFDNNYIFKYNPSVKMLIWRSNNVYVQIQLYTDYLDLPEEIISAYLEIYPSDCDEDSCPSLEISIEKIYERFFLGYYSHTSGLFFKHNGFSIKCRNIVKHGKEGATEYPDLDYNQFKGRVKEYLSDLMYFSEDELKQLYDRCIEEGGIKIEGLPLSGFLKDCYDKVSPRLVEDNEEDRIDEKSLRLCDNINLIIIKNNEYFEKLKEKRGYEIINQIIDFIVQKELEKIEQHKKYCEEFGIVDQVNEDGTIEKNIYNCEIDYKPSQICYEQEDGKILCEEEESDEEGVVRLEPCTEEDLEEGLDCIPVKEVEDKKPIEEPEVVGEKEFEEVSEEVIKEENIANETQIKEEPIEKEPEPERQNVFKKIISWIINLFG